ncbi:Acyl-CoA dehydrogenase, short-chain specific [Nocardioides dubius]|uniref:acyl-CoA dehydrogenase family protein n=2 Tax=Nocardioides dubius TaxID=317019 RepID=UPI0039E7700F
MILADLELAETRAELVDVVDAMVQRVAPRTDAVLRADKAAGGVMDDALWRRLNSEIGAAGLAVPEEWGGSGASLAELAAVAEILGAQLTTVPLLGTWLALETLVRSGDAAQTATVASALEAGDALAVSFDTAQVRAEQLDGGWSLTGELDRVVDVAEATTLVLAARATDEVRWFVLPTSAVEVTRRDALDLTRSLSLVRLDGVAAQPVEVADAAALLRTMRDIAAVLIAAEQLGVAEQAVADAVAYAKEREQFGRAIGSFQAIKHCAADMATEADLARSLVEHAVWAAVEAPAALPGAAASALVEASRSACWVSAENVQIHGGIGFSWEHPAHLYFRKARSNEMLWGDVAAWAEQAFDAYAYAADAGVGES